jgi:hypothetical protein
MNPRVTKVEAIKDYRVFLEFKNGEHRIYDFNPLLDFGIFKELKDFHYFNKVKLENGTISWPNGQDICPDTLYLDSEPVN